MTVATKSRPIIMSAEDVRATLDGRKTQTRIVVEPQPEFPAGLYTQDGHGNRSYPSQAQWSERNGVWTCGFPGYSVGEWLCPYGVAGDLLWVRETALYWVNTNDNSTSYVAAFKADGYELQHGESWRSPVCMPKLLARLWLRVANVRVQRVQEISAADCEAEGIVGTTHASPCNGLPYEIYTVGGVEYSTPKEALCGHWDSLNAKRGHPWSNNDWVWAVTFEQAGTAGSQEKRGDS